MRTYSFLAITNRLNSWPIQICLTPAKLILVIYTTVAIVLCKTLWNYDRNGDFQTFCCKWTGVWMSIYGWHLMDPWILFFGKHMIIHEKHVRTINSLQSGQCFQIYLFPMYFFRQTRKFLSMSSLFTNSPQETLIQSWVYSFGSPFRGVILNDGMDSDDDILGSWMTLWYLNSSPWKITMFNRYPLLSPCSLQLDG